MSKWIFWLGVVLVADAAIDLYALDFFQKRFPQITVRNIALCESLIGLVLLIIYFAFR